MKRAALCSAAVLALLWAGSPEPASARQIAPAASAALGDPSGALPYELAFQRREFRRNDPAVASPDGRRLAFVVVSPPDIRAQEVRFSSTGAPVSAAGAQIHLSDRNERSFAAEPICGGRGNQWNPAWAPGGDRLAFYSDAEGRPELWILDVANGECRQVGEGAIRASAFRGFEPRWSSDGRSLYVPLRPDPPLETSDAEVINAFDPDGGQADAAPLILASGAEAALNESAGPRASDDYRGFLLSNYNAALAVVDAQTGVTHMLADARVEPRPSTVKPSPSGRWIVYASVPSYAAPGTPPGRSLALIDPAGNTPRTLVEDLSSDVTGSDYMWRPKRDQLVYLHRAGLWAMDFSETGAEAPVRLAESFGDVAGTMLYFTRDGASAVVGVDAQGRGRNRKPSALALIPLDGRPPVRVALPDPQRWDFIDLVRADAETLWQPDARHLTAQVRERTTGEQALFRLDLETGQSRLLTSGLRRLHSFASGGDHRDLYVVQEDVDTPPDLYRFNATLNQQTRVSMIEPRLEDVRLGGVHVATVAAPLHDGQIADVRTTLLLPPGAKAGDKLPAIVMIYAGEDLSGSASQYGGGSGNSVPNSIFTSRGFAVVMADIRLSPEGQSANPLQDMTDVLLPQVYALADAGWIDIRRLAISGQSYGGYSTAAIVSSTNLFRAAIPVNGLYDLGNRYAEMDSQGNSHPVQWAEKGQGRMGESVWDDPLRYVSNSPFYRLDRIRTPLFIVAGERDNAVPFEQSTGLFVGLRRLERPAQLAVYPGQGHVISEWSLQHAVDASRRMVEFLRRYLGEPQL